MEEDSWNNLASLVLAFASQQSGIPGASEASQVVLALCGIEDEQATMLRRIQSDVALLRMGPFRLEESYGCCVTASRELVARANNLAVLRSRRIDTLMVATHLIGPFVIMRSLQRSPRSRVMCRLSMP
jgi:hypothetical protein